jgi:hypothetical protein
VGPTTPGPVVDFNTPGRAQAYRVTSTATEKVDTLSIYIDGSSRLKDSSPASSSGCSPARRTAPAGASTGPPRRAVDQSSNPLQGWSARADDLRTRFW